MAEDDIGEALSSETQPDGEEVAESIDVAVKESGELSASIEEGASLGGDGDVVDDEVAAEEVAEEDSVEDDATTRERRMWKPNFSKDGSRPDPTLTSAHGQGGGQEGNGVGDALENIARKGVEDGEGETLENVPSFSNEETYESDSVSPCYCSIGMDAPQYPSARLSSIGQQISPCLLKSIHG